MQPRHGGQQQQDNKPLYGWLWRRLATNSWERFYCRGSSKKITIFADDKEEDVVDVIPLNQVSLSEVTFQDAFKAVGGGACRRHSRGLLLRVARAASLLDDLTGSETESLLHGRPGSGSSLASSLLALREEVLLAAENAQQHAAWLKRISKLCASKAKLLDDGNSEGRQARLYSTGIRSPPQAVLQRLCGPGLVRGKQLMERLKYTRWQLEAGLRDLSSVRDEARNAQRPLNDLHAILLDMSQALDVHHGQLYQEADVTALRLCQDWLQSAITFVMETDHNIEQLVFAEPGSNVAADWVPLAQNTILQLRDIEDAMRAEELRQLLLHRKQQGPSSSPVDSGLCRSYVAAPAMPYGRWWAGKVAL